MESIKKILRPIYIPILSSNFVKNILLLTNTFEDFLLYRKYSLTFTTKNLKNKEADLILNYHSLEKGMLFKEMKAGFAAVRIKNLHKILNDPEIMENINRSQIKVGYQVMCQYYELHQEANFNIEHIYSLEQYKKYKNLLKDHYDSKFNGIIDWKKEKYYKNINSNFYDFAHSRKSVREFTGQRISHELLNKVIKLANTAPSVCNRQSNNVYLIEDKAKIDRILKIQGGFTGYTKDVSQLLILTNDRNYYYTVGERNQFYVDGGIYLMNLLYALHFYKIGNCPANWGKLISDEKTLSMVIDLPSSEKIICMIPIGELKEGFRTTLSERRPTVENFIVKN
ncbi:nitroreductase family protein [Sphingobacterium rhinopitheci]|uniref:nitroreductase family protein n=1 Tax=Sphingobacterium rhinopitheci TaxID=2781960 RepID=UPI001F529084|nr:nitroreductase family protein [Sphingobacterium rhinopitheci]MCI0920634.1 nitroreductase family protein [Sphingobacterium rhinopitheci]